MNIARTLIIIGILWCVSIVAISDTAKKVKVTTDLGSFTIELLPHIAPISVNNFLEYVASDFYVGTVFHRVVPGFVVQGGGLTYDFTPKKTRAAIKNEASKKLKNTVASVAMARTSDPDSATSQFYINVNDNSSLDISSGKAGYAVFGRVIEGMETIKKIEKEPRGLYRNFPEAPNYPVRILKASIVD